MSNTAKTPLVTFDAAIANVPYVLPRNRQGRVRVNFLTRNIVQHDLSHLRTVNRVIGTRGNFARDRQGIETMERIFSNFNYNAHPSAHAFHNG